ncbi:hypothetical protein [Paraglaciecola psychrophila]|uniref:Uncharacterized protein n=1 Tax=Paraglaciecola psychrophila 170 TaxID=1129794 RepID=K7AGR6_9ALTE|nr:hypothetical protein [Paraglaciecola psychrophila]AGH45976.1 hypothetical protein C427_3871 [Paraglaciecola psychrophila 170]GAC39788.1 hypothetical protein GPSY_4177 [Paraglaciecola psychrophila 170]
MAFADRYLYNKMHVEARLKITESMAKRSEQLNETLQDPALRAEDLSARYEREILKQINEDKLNGELEQIFTFYEQIILCRELDLCEEKVSGQFFDTDAQGFVNTYYPYICNVRKEWHNPEQYKKITQFYSPKLTCEF